MRRLLFSLALTATLAAAAPAQDKVFVLDTTTGAVTERLSAVEKDHADLRAEVAELKKQLAALAKPAAKPAACDCPLCPKGGKCDPCACPKATAATPAATLTRTHPTLGAVTVSPALAAQLDAGTATWGAGGVPSASPPAYLPAFPFPTSCPNGKCPAAR
jgi:hypothetical protein